MALSGIVSQDCFSHKRAASRKASLSFRSGLHLMTSHYGEGDIKGAQPLLQSRTTRSRRNDSSGPFQLQNCLSDQTKVCCNCIAIHLHLPNSTSFTLFTLSKFLLGAIVRQIKVRHREAKIVSYHPTAALTGLQASMDGQAETWAGCTPQNPKV